MKLTREEILSLLPGRELDALIAKHVMGLDMVEDQLPQLPRYYLTDYEKTIHRDVPLYSSDISAAWEVVTHLKSKYWYFMLSDENEGWEASFYWDPHRPAYEALSAEAPQAICKAALLASLKL